MKYGEQFEKESVPQWSLHNIDYNSLKHHIKVHTTKDQATAIAIPGRRDTALGKFEDELYSELCCQHDRVHLFVTSKADEIARRLQHLSNQIHRLILRCATSGRERMSMKRRQRFAKYEQELLQCGDDIRSLERFVSAQIVAFRKILKKYRKWTGSSALGSRFRDNVLADPKSFTRRDFSQLQTQYNDLIETLHAALPANFDLTPQPARESRQSPSPSAQLSPSETIVPESQPVVVSGGYWNEYDCGSEAGDLDPNADEYAIYIDPNADVSFPGMKVFSAFFTKPVQKLSAWISPRRRDVDANDDERGPLLPTHSDDTPYGSARVRSPPSLSYFTTPPGGITSTGTRPDPLSSSLDTDDETSTSLYPSHRHSRRGSNGASNGGGSYPSSLDDPSNPLPPPISKSSFSFPPGYRAHYAADTRPPHSHSHSHSHSTASISSSSYSCSAATNLPSLSDQRLALYRARVLAYAVWACFAVAVVLTSVAGVLVVVAGRHRNARLRVEIDAGVTLGIVTSLGLACAGVCMAFAGSGSEGTRGRGRGKGWVVKGVVGTVFTGVCVVNGVLLVVVMGRGV